MAGKLSGTSSTTARIHISAALVVASLLAGPAFADCSLTSTGLVPLTDMASGDLYLGQYEGGLYPGGTSIRPKSLIKASKKRSKAIEPLDRNGDPDPEGGSILFLSIGISNTKLEFDNFQVRAEADDSVNPQVVMFNAAQGGTPADEWVDPNGEPWTKIERFIERQGFSPEQVQAVWIKHAHRMPAENGPFPTHAQLFQNDLEGIARALRRNYPNIQIVYLSSRTRAYTDKPTDQSPEPYAYENGFAVKWLIEKQLDGDADLAYEGEDDPAPLLLWGPYIWADGTTGRSDGFVWTCQDTRTNEFVHPSENGMQKVGDQLLAFFKTHPTSRKWFLQGGKGGKPKLSITISSKKGPSPHAVQFSVNATLNSGAKKIRDISWTFDDGTFARTATATKVFKEPGTYKIWVTVADEFGKTRSKKKKITVTN